MPSLKISDGDLLGLIDNIYAASLEPDAWQVVVDSLNRAIPNVAFGLHGMHTGSNPEYLFVQSGYEPDTVEEFVSEYAPINPWRGIMPLIPSGEVFTPNFSRFAGAFHNTDYYSFLARRNIDAGVAAAICNENSRTFHLSADYSVKREGEYAEPLAHFIGQIMPHLARSFEICHRSAAGRAGAASLDASIHNFAAPAIAVTADLRVRTMNEVAGKLFATKCGLKLSGTDLISIEDPAADAALRKAVASETNRGLSTPSQTNISFRFPASAGRGRITVVPLKADASLSQGPVTGFLGVQERLALLLIKLNDDDDELFTEAIQSRFGLTPAQTRLACALCRGMSLDQHANMQGLKISTVRNHLQALFEKSATNRQSQLVALLLDNAVKG